MSTGCTFAANDAMYEHISMIATFEV